MKKDWLIQKLKLYYSDEEVALILKGYQTKRFPSFRVNTLKITKEEVEKELTFCGYLLEEVSWYPNAFIVKNKTEKDLRELELYQNGCIYLQSLSSLLPVCFLNPKEKDTILDMAAAPGSKTTQIGIETQNKCSITACEKNKIRVQKLKYNLEKQGISSCTVIEKDARVLDDLFRFDKVLLDAPCSGTGTLHENTLEKNEMLNEYSLKRIRNTQIELLRKGLKVLKKNETLVYSTCSILKEENEEVIKALQKEFDFSIVPIEIEGLPLLKSSLKGVITLYPDSYYEGFFVAKLKKKE